MKNLLYLFLILAFAANARRPVIETHSFDYIFPPGVEGRDWFSKMAYDGHSMVLVKDGKDALKKRLDLINSAAQSILLSTFIYDVDKSATQITDALCKKAKQGVDVRLIIDSVNSTPFYKKSADRLRQCGAGVILFKPGRWDLLDIVQVLHDKLLIIDGETVYLGGRGVQNAYHDVKPAHKFFHDLDIIVEGPVACWWQFEFIEMYNKIRSIDRPFTVFAKDEDYFYGKKEYRPCYPFTKGESRVIPVYGNPIFNPKTTPIEDIYVKALENLPRGASVKLYAPYFVATERFGNALLKAKKMKNAKISIITNSLTSNDVGVPVMVAMTYTIGHLVDAGIDIRLYPGPQTLHRKAGVYGGKYGYVGSDNLDRRGQHYQTESVVFTDDRKIVQELEAEFDRDYAQTSPLTRKYFETIRKKAGVLEAIFAKQLKEFF